MILFRCLSILALAVATASGLPADPLLAAPVPPQQAAPWNLPGGVDDPDDKIRAAVDLLFSVGLADPRGCPYHHVTVKEGGVEVEARGWVLPTSKNVIGWNGLVYPVEQVGGAADLAADVEILKKKGELQDEPFANFREESLDGLLEQFGGRLRMMRSWAAPYLLLRLGFPISVAPLPDDPFSDHAAFDFGKEGKPTFSEWYFKDAAHPLVDFGLLLRGDGVAAFVDKNDPLASARLTMFDAVWAEVGKRLPHVEGEVEGGVDSFSDDTRPKLNPGWRSLLVDAQRRMESTDASALPGIASEIATWDHLEIWDHENPPSTFEKVVAAGSSAIGPLLECIENDLRWTRVINYRHGIAYGDGTKGPCRLLRVRDLAILAMERVLRFQIVELPFESVPLEDSWYADVAASLRAACGKYDNACGGELWFRVLKDPDADLGLRLAAAEWIVRPDGTEDHFPDWFFSPSSARERFDNPAPSREGKLLRGRRDPSVLDLLKQANLRARALAEEQLAGGAPEGTMGSCGGGVYSFPRGIPHQFVRLMEEWQPGNIDVLRSHYEWLSAALHKLQPADGPGAGMVLDVCEETLVRRLWSHDDNAMRDYEKLFRSSSPFNRVPIKVMKEFPELPGMDELAKEAFLGEEAPLSLIHKPWSSHDSRESAIQQIGGGPSPLLVLPSFRQALVEALETTTKQGTVVTTGDGATLKYGERPSGDDRDLGDNSALRGTGEIGSVLEVRTCDLIAYFLTPKRGPAVWVSPSYHLDDPLAVRDAAIDEWIKILSSSRPE